MATLLSNKHVESVLSKIMREAKSDSMIAELAELLKSHQTPSAWTTTTVQEHAAALIFTLMKSWEALGMVVV